MRISIAIFRVDSDGSLRNILKSRDKCGLNWRIRDNIYRETALPDSIDLGILTALQEDARVTMAALADRVGLSPPACYRRVRALRAQRLIEREVALVAPRTMGWNVTMVVLVTLERDRGRIVDDLIGRLRQAREVTDVWYVTGDHDLVLHVAAEDMGSYDAFVQRVLHAEEHVRSFKTLVVMQQGKRAAALPAV